MQIGTDAWVLELFHGPTLAFKDIAMQVLARLMDHALRKRGTRATIIGATSGDTGSAAIEAFRGREAPRLREGQTDFVILLTEGYQPPGFSPRTVVSSKRFFHCDDPRAEVSGCQRNCVPCQNPKS